MKYKKRKRIMKEFYSIINWRKIGSGHGIVWCELQRALGTDTAGRSGVLSVCPGTIVPLCSALIQFIVLHPLPKMVIPFVAIRTQWSLQRNPLKHSTDRTFNLSFFQLLILFTTFCWSLELFILIHFIHEIFVIKFGYRLFI